MEFERYADFSARLHQQIVGKRYPINGTIEITRRCPLTCAHCYNNLPMNDHEARRGELTYEEHCRLLDELAEAGCMWLLYSGGEIFARPDFLDIYAYAKQKGMIVTLFTNGILINEKIADFLAANRPFGIEITLYGRTKETYERLTGIPGSYERCLNGIRLLKERNLPLKLKTVAVTINKHELWEMKRFSEEDLGVEFKFDSLMTPRIDCSQSPLAVRLTPREVVEIDLQSQERMDEFRKFQDIFGGTCEKREKSDEVYQCGGGVNAFAIDPEGKLSICVLSHFEKYDLRKGSFADGWDGFLGKVREKKTTMVTKCRTCSIQAMCGMCPANGELENGHAEKPVDFLCEVAHLRAHTFDIPVERNPACEFSEGGERYDELMENVRKLKRLKDEGVPEFQETAMSRRSLPVFKQAAIAGSCSI